MQAEKITYDPSAVEKNLLTALETLSETYPVSTVPSPDSHKVTYQKSDTPGFFTERTKDGWCIKYSNLQSALRGTAFALAGQSGSGVSSFKTTGIMLDASRSAVFKNDYVKRWMRILAMLGYNRLMLYTEDTYKLPGEPMWGFMRGAYSEEDLKEFDDYANLLGIELVGCIQTLGHLDQPLRWEAYSKIKDTQSVMLVDEPATYELIEKMIACFARNYRSRTIHIGMDETHDLGRGRYLDRNGYERGFDLFNRHLQKVTEICRKYGLKPMLWSDMYFRLGSKSLDYYDPQCVIPEDVKQAIPKDADIVYWDYYHDNEKFYTNYINRHKDLGGETHLYSGIWCWGGMWYQHTWTTATAAPAIKAARKAKIDHISFTMWGDEGSYCNFDSTLAGVAWAADMCWGGKGSAVRLIPVCSAVCNIDYTRTIAMAEAEHLNRPTLDVRSSGRYLLWDDPLLAPTQNDITRYYPEWREHAIGVYHKLLAMRAAPDQHHIAHFKVVLKSMLKAVEFRRDFVKCYQDKDIEMAKDLKKRCRDLIRQYKRLWNSYRTQWLSRNKSFGFEVTSHRIGAVIMRYEEIALRLEEFIADTSFAIPELDEYLAMPPDAVFTVPSIRGTQNIQISY